MARKLSAMTDPVTRLTRPSRAGDPVMRLARVRTWIVSLAAMGVGSCGFVPTGPTEPSDPLGPGTYAYVVRPNKVEVIDVGTNTVTSTLTFGRDWLYQIAVTPDGAFAYVDQGECDDEGEWGPPEYASLAVIDLATDNTLISTVSVDGDCPGDIAFTPDGAFAYVTALLSGDVWVIDLATHTIISTVSVASFSSHIAITPDGAFAYLTNRICSGNGVSVMNLTTNTIVSSVSGDGACGRDIAITPDGAFAYVVSGNSVSVIDLATNTIVSTVSVGDSPEDVAITPDGAFAYVANYRSDNVSVIDLATHTIVSTVPVGDAPGDIAITPDGAFAYVANFRSDNVSVIDLATNTVVSTVSVGGPPLDIAIRRVD